MNFWKTININLLIQQIAGISLFSFSHNNIRDDDDDVNLKVSVFARIYSMLLLSLYLILNVIGLLFGDKELLKSLTPDDEESMSYVAMIILFCEVNFVNLFFVINQLIAQCNILNQILFLKKIYKIDQILLMKLNCTINYKKFRRINIYIILLLFIVFILLTLNLIWATLRTKHYVLIFSIIITIQIFCRLVAIFAYFSYSCLIYFRYQILTDLLIENKLEKKLEQKSLLFSSMKTTKPTTEMIKQKNYKILIYCILYTKLNDTIELLNKAFGSVILLTTIHSFTSTLTQSFLLFIYLSTSKMITVHYLRNTFLWILQDIIKIVLVTFITQFVIDKVIYKF